MLAEGGGERVIRRSTCGQQAQEGPNELVYIILRKSLTSRFRISLRYFVRGNSERRELSQCIVRLLNLFTVPFFVLFKSNCKFANTLNKVITIVISFIV